jgi:hypothetical protein
MIDHPTRQLICPGCHCVTTNLKEYVFLERWLFLPPVTSHEMGHVSGCPHCVRAEIWNKATGLIWTAHLSWPFVVLPWALCLSACSFLQGHSSSVLTPDREPQDVQAWRAWLAVLSLKFFCYLPVVGVAYCLVAWRLTRGDDAHLRFYCQAGLIVSVAITALLAGAIAYDGFVNGWDNVAWW